MTEAAYRCGFIAVVGRPNVGKSTLTNALIGSKITIVSRKAQTTRHRIQGVLTREHEQFVFVDSEKDQKLFFDAIINPPKPHKNLLKAAKNYNKLVASK